jgi:SAM-dependent methyltransferase
MDPDKKLEPQLNVVEPNRKNLARTGMSRKRQLLFLEHPNVGETKSMVLYDEERQSPVAPDMPIPPPEYMQYGESVQNHLAGGKRDSENLRSILSEGGFDPSKCERFLEFGCANGRVLRWFADWAQTSEGWGVDINSASIMWAARNLRPPFKFAVTTTMPHLPFESNYFGLVFAFSIFTHIDDLFITWLAELCRVIRPGGYLFVTIHDEATMRALHERPAGNIAKILMDNEHHSDFESGQIGMLSVNRDVQAQVLFKRDFFVGFLQDFFEVVSVTERTMAGHQTGILVRKRIK